MKRLKFLATLLALLFVTGMQAQKKQNLKVLFVGGTPDFNVMGVAQKPDSVKVAKSAKARTASWTAMLKKYFTNVKSVQGKDYNQSMSDNYDVTIFDGTPKALSEDKVIRDADGNFKKRIPAAYLTKDFNRPAITIAETSQYIGRSLGLKNDWYCLCLLGDALGWKADHDVFKSPFKVNLNTFMDDTPTNAQEIATIFGTPLPAKTKMWKVQTRNYEQNPDMRIGMVSRPDGYGDPDDEVISSGRCAKSIDAVAIGRHGNFLHWGFAASPNDMTEQAKQVFANCVVYISNHATKVIARKMDENISTRHWLGAKHYTDSRQGWEDDCKANDNFYHIIDSVKTAAKAKQAKGEELSDAEAMYLNFPDERRPNPTLGEYLKERERELYKYFGINTQLYVDYYNYNYPYFHADGYDLIADEDARELGIANNDKKLLDTCIEMLEKNSNDNVARTLLERYTLCRFKTAQEWRTWYETYKDKLFFSEGGGFLWLVDSQEDNVAGNDYSVLDAKEETPAPKITGATDKRNPVLIEGALNKTEDGGKELVITVKIHPGFHIYANVSDKDPFLPTDIKLELPEGIAKDGAMKLPSPQRLDNSDTTGYEGECVFRQRLTGNGAGKIRCTVNYQCCDNTICLTPAVKVMEFEY